MKKKFSLRLLLLLSLALLFVASVVVLSACNQDEDPFEFVAGQGNTVQVVLDSLKNGVIDYRLKPGSPIPEPGVTKDTTAPVAEGFLFDGYYEGTINDDGEVEYGEKWDFSRKVDKDTTLYGKWLIQYKIRVNYILNGQLQDRSESTNVSGNAETVNTIKQPVWQGNTYVQMFLDKDCTEPLVVSKDQPFAHGCTQEDPVRDVYAQFIEGSWTLVRTASDLTTINGGSRLYLMNDIDMSSLNQDGVTKMSAAESFSGVIEGNGYTISNMHYYRQGATGTGYTSYCIGLFAQINGATIRNITFENCSVSGSIRKQSPEYMYGFIAGRTLVGTEQHRESTFENISFVNCELKPLEFNILGVSDIEAERDKIEQNFFIGDGSYSDVVAQNFAALTKLVLGNNK